MDGARAALDGEDVSVDEDFDRAAYDVTSRELAKYAGEIPTGNDVGARAMEAIVAEKEAARDANVERDAWFASTRASMGTPDGDAEATSTSTSRSMSRRESADDEVHPAVAKYGGARAGTREQEGRSPRRVRRVEIVRASFDSSPNATSSTPSREGFSRRIGRR